MGQAERHQAMVDVLLVATEHWPPPQTAAQHREQRIGDDGGWGEGSSYWRGTFEHAAFQDTLLALREGARARNLTFLSGEGLISAGSGAWVVVWPSSELPQPSSVVLRALTTPSAPSQAVQRTAAPGAAARRR